MRNIVATTSASSEVADLSELPGRVEATTQPTSKPISAVVETGMQGSENQGTGNREQGTATMLRAQMPQM